MSTYQHRIAERRRPEATGESGRPAAAHRASPDDFQRRLIEALRAESCLDPDVPLGMSHWGRPLSGPSGHAYYTAKHERGERGTYWPLHRVAFPRKPS